MNKLTLGTVGSMENIFAGFSSFEDEAAGSSRREGNFKWIGFREG